MLGAAMRYNTSRDAFTRIVWGTRHLSDEQKIDKLADHVQDALHNAVGGVTDRLRNAQHKGALDDAWTKYDTAAARPALRQRRQQKRRPSRRDRLDRQPPAEQYSTGYMTASSRRRQCEERHPLPHDSASSSDDYDSDPARVECEQLNLSQHAFSKAVKARHPEDKYVHRWRQQPAQPFGLHHDRQRQGHDEHNAHWQYLAQNVPRRRQARSTPHELDGRGAAPLESVHASETVPRQAGDTHTVSIV